MKRYLKKSLLVGLFFSCFFLDENIAQKAPDCVKAAKVSRPTYVLVSPRKLHSFYRNYKAEADFGNTKIVKTDLAYYLLAAEANGNRIFAFELETKGKKLYLNKTLPVQSCSEGELSLDTFLKMDGKIKGCRIGSHTIQQ